MTLPGGVDAGAVWGAGGVAAFFVAIAIPMWRNWMAKQLTETGKVTGEAEWQKRQATTLTEREAMVNQLIELRRADAELIASLKLDKALNIEKLERERQMREHLERRLAKLENILISIRPDLEDWIRDLPGPAPQLTLPTI